MSSRLETVWPCEPPEPGMGMGEPRVVEGSRSRMMRRWVLGLASSRSRERGRFEGEGVGEWVSMEEIWDRMLGRGRGDEESGRGERRGGGCETVEF